MRILGAAQYFMNRSVAHPTMNPVNTSADLEYVLLRATEKIIIQPCLPSHSASALRHVLHISICGTCRALNLSKNPAQSLDN